jgi:CheY-like chemotaxis protein
VLLAEDEPQVCDIEAEYLRGDGHFVETATNGRDAMELFTRWGYDVVVVDRAMPEMNGDQLTAAIKQMSPKTPVVMVTGFADMPVEGTGAAPQPDLILRKPIAQLTLRQAIARVMAPAPPAAKPAPTLVHF